MLQTSTLKKTILNKNLGIQIYIQHSSINLIHIQYPQFQYKLKFFNVKKEPNIKCKYTLDHTVLKIYTFQFEFRSTLS